MVVQKKRLKAIESTLKRIEESLKCQDLWKTSPPVNEQKAWMSKKIAEAKKEVKFEEEPSVVYTDPTEQFLDEVKEKLGLKPDADLEDIEVSYSSGVKETPIS